MFGRSLALRERDRDRLATLGRRASTAYELHDHLFSSPAVNARRAQEVLSVSQPTANRLLNDLERLGLLREWTGRQRGRSWIYQDYFEIFRDALIHTENPTDA